MSDPKEKEVADLCLKYHVVIGNDHHKDRDCHFFISKRWSYGHPKGYEIKHSGYLMDTQPEQLEEYATYEAARDALIAMLTRAIANETGRRDSEGCID
jgi:hypothetical protein